MWLIPIVSFQTLVIFQVVLEMPYPQEAHKKNHNITIILMDPRSTKVSKSIFYRGISLKDYLRKSSIAHRNLEYPDDQTILLDQNKTPVFIDDAFILSQPPEQRPAKLSTEPKIVSQSYLPGQRSNIELPTLKSKKKLKVHTNSYHTDRNSTDTSFGSSFDLRILLPEIQKSQISRQKNNLVSSRSESKSVSHRKKHTEGIKDLELVEQEPFKLKDKHYVSREYTELIKKEIMLKHRYNIQGEGKAPKGPNARLRFFNRVKSNAE